MIQKQEQKTSFFVYVLLTQVPSWDFQINSIELQRLSPKRGILSYASPPIQKLHLCGNIISKSYKPTFHSSHLSHNISYSSAATIWVFCLPWQRYSYLTWSSIVELLCQCLNTKTSTWGNRGFTTETLSISYTIRLYIRLVVTL